MEQNPFINFSNSSQQQQHDALDPPRENLVQVSKSVEHLKPWQPTHIRSKSDPRAAMGLDMKFALHRSPSDPELTQIANPTTDQLIEIETSSGPQKENWNPFSPYYTAKDVDFTVDPSQCDDDLDFASLRENLPLQLNDPEDVFDGVKADPALDFDPSGMLSPGEIPHDAARNPFFQIPALINVEVNSDSSGSRSDSPNQLQRTVSPPLSPSSADPFGAVPFNLQNRIPKNSVPASPDVFGAAPFDISTKKDGQNYDQANQTKIKDEFSPFGTQFTRQDRRDDAGRESPKTPFDLDAFSRGTERVAVSGSSGRDQKMLPGFDNPVLESLDGPHDPFGSAPFNSGRNNETKTETKNYQSPKRTKPGGDRPRRQLPQTPTQTAQTGPPGPRQKAEQTIVLSRPTRPNR